MAKELRADPVELTRLATGVLAVGDGLVAASARSAQNLQVPPGGFGNVPGAAALQAAHAEAINAAVTLSSRLGEVAGNDGDKLYRTAFAYQHADEQNEATTPDMV